MVNLDVWTLSVSLSADCFCLSHSSIVFVKQPHARFGRLVYHVVIITNLSTKVTVRRLEKNVVKYAVKGSITSGEGLSFHGSSSCRLRIPNLRMSGALIPLPSRSIRVLSCETCRPITLSFALNFKSWRQNVCYSNKQDKAQQSHPWSSNL
jgi:hypothetical protein